MKLHLFLRTKSWSGYSILNATSNSILPSSSHSTQPNGQKLYLQCILKFFVSFQTWHDVQLISHLPLLILHVSVNPSTYQSWTMYCSFPFHVNTYKRLNMRKIYLHVGYVKFHKSYHSNFSLTPKIPLVTRS